MKGKTKASLQELINNAAQERSVPGAVLALWRAGKLDVVATGTLNIDTGEQVRPDSLFQIGSITKVLTATVAMRLVDEGKLKLDAPVRDYLPQFRLADLAATKAITVRQLLCHTSGIDGDFVTDTGAGPDRLARYLDRCALLPQAFPPGKGFSYSNAAFTILGRIIEVVTGLDFDSAFKKYLFDRLGLKNSVCDICDLPGRSIAAGHVPDPDRANAPRRVPLFTIPPSGAPAGSTTMMSAADLVSFARMHLQQGKNDAGEQVLSGESVMAMRETQVDVPIPARGISRWGLGWFIMEVCGVQVFGHDGATVGQAAYLRIDKVSGTIAAVFANGGAANDFMMDVFAETFDPLAGFSQPPAPQASGSPPARLDRYAGTFRNVGGDTVFTLQDGKLIRTSFFRFDDLLINYPAAELHHSENDSFIWFQPPVEYPSMVTFSNFDAKGQPQTIFSGLRVSNRVI